MCNRKGFARTVHVRNDAIVDDALISMFTGIFL